MNAALPPAFCVCAIACRVSVVLPLDSGPKISTMRPRGYPPMPSAPSSERAPVGMHGMRFVAASSPSRMSAFSPCSLLVAATKLSSSWTLSDTGFFVFVSLIVVCLSVRLPRNKWWGIRIDEPSKDRLANVMLTDQLAPFQIRQGSRYSQHFDERASAQAQVLHGSLED